MAEARIVKFCMQVTVSNPSLQ